ncbi:E3 ubiquitin-protein ligase arkadia-A [Zea mays]|uniref:E3 ubiquitin-protein ligase arkadia-A n=1 Tax=Zea mays TaxID=4577 RepID=A0A3L6G0R4_MAIZE|nr:E3 ubiquitin-protein ligase arkadia-A [Zea mays]
MASLQAALLLLPAFSVVAVAARWVCRALARSHLACLPSGSPSFRYLVSSSPSSSSVVDKGGGELPVALYSRRTKRRRCVGEEEEEERCVFCLSSIEEGSEVRELRCRHLFHRACLDRWVRARPAATCPLCRGRLLTSLPWEVAGYYHDEEEEEEVEMEEESDMMLFMACVHSRSTWLWPS